MPNIKSAKKRVLIIEKKNDENKTQMTLVRNAIKKINAAIDTNRIEDAEKMLPEVFATLDKAVTKGVMHKNTAANKKAGIAKRIDEIKSGKKEVVIKKDNKTIAAEKAKAAQAAREAQRAEIVRKNAEKKAAAEAAKAAAEAEKKKAGKKPAKVKEEKPDKKAAKVKEEKPEKKAKKTAKAEEKAE